MLVNPSCVPMLAKGIVYINANLISVNIFELFMLIQIYSKSHPWLSITYA
jgi:hypothetical protein